MNKKEINLSILDEYDNVPIAVASKLLNKNEEFVRQIMKDGRCPFGIATKTGEKNWNFHISPGMLKAYISGTMCIQFNQLKEPNY